MGSENAKKAIALDRRVSALDLAQDFSISSNNTLEVLAREKFEKDHIKLDHDV